MNNVSAALRSFRGLKAWEGEVPLGFRADFLGVMIDLRFREPLGVVPSQHGGNYQRHDLPTLASYGEGFFEVLQWVETARAAREKYVMISLGACFGLQAVGCYKALQAINPMPAKLVMVEPEPGNVEWITKHLTDNGIDPKDHWIVPMVVSDRHDPALFPKGHPGTGTHNCFSVNHPDERRKILEKTIREGQTEKVLSEIFLHSTTGIACPVTNNQGMLGEVGYFSCITLSDLLAPFEHVDYVEADLQSSESVVFASCLDVLWKKVRRIYIGTHSEDIHGKLEKLFADAGWNILFSFVPFKIHQTDAGSFKADDGVLILSNPSR
jgi:hypothetical protein